MTARLPTVARDASAEQRAYSLLEIKAVDEEKGIIEGIASTPAPDRYGDIVEPKGAEFKLPMPFLWQHDSWSPIGEVTKAKVTKEGIAVSIRVALELSDRVSYIKDAWELIKGGLVRGLSIGFRSLEHAFIEGTYGIHFQKWEWMELSAVTIPANSDASITSIKSAYLGTQRAPSGGNAERPVVRLKSSPAVAGTSATPAKGKDVKTFAERIAAFEAKKAANAERILALMSKEDGAVTLDDAEKTEHDTLAAEIKEIDEHISRLKAADALNKAAAVPAREDRGTEAGARAPALSGIRAQTQVPKGMAFARYAKAFAAAKASGGQFSALQYAESQKHWADTTPQVLDVMKAGVAGGTSTASAWADDLVYAQNLGGEFIELLYPATIIGRIPNLRRVPFNVRMGSATSGGTGYWVGEGQPIPVSKMQTDNLTMTIAKAAGLMVITRELARLSTPQAEMIVRDDLIKTVTKFLDQQFIDPNFGPVTSTGAPGAVTYGIPSTQVRQASGTTAAALRADFAALADPIFTANVDPNDAVWITTPLMAMKIGMINTSLGTREFPDINMNGGSLFGLPVIVSQAAYVSGSPDYGHLIVLVKPSDIFIGDEGGIEVDARDDVSIQMDDAPTNNVTTPTATSLISMWQTESVAIKVVRYINWKRRRSTAVGYIRSAAYADA